MSYDLAQLTDFTFKEIGRGEIMLCDGNCRKAWGINNRPKIEFSEADPDDYAFLPDGELGEAPEDPGTYEGGHGKPDADAGPNRQNKWCYRECERSMSLDAGEAFRRPPGFSKRLYNKRSREVIENS
ncbi:hypothetical protein GOB57_21965 [Sinorhizobium meliloti]|nr:hypothetical protein [Sinorhizobium meliloti]